MKTNLVQKLMDETIAMPGFPQILVSRSWAYQFLKGCGWDESERGFGSLDYTIFASKAIESLPTLEGVRDQLLAGVIETYQREVA